MSRSCSRVSAWLVVLLAAMSPFALAQPAPPGASVRAEPEVAAEIAHARGRAQAARLRVARVNAIVLERAMPDEVAERIAPPRKGVPLQVAFGRELAATRTEPALRSLLSWESLPDGGQVAALSLSSPEARAVRAGLHVTALPPDVILRFSAPDVDEMFEVTGAEIMETIERNLRSGEHHADARMYWAPALESDSVVIEFELPAERRPEELHVSIPQLSHFIASARDDFAPKAASSSCQLDATCYSSTWGSESNAVARMVFMVGSSGYQCSGTLIVDRDTATTIPYFLTANHCISSQTVASTLQTYWFYRAPSCNSGTSSWTTLAGGATLLYATGNTDTSFMRLNTPPPGGATYAGWLVGTTPALNAPMTGLHHPKGDPLKISFATLWAYARCFPSGTETFSCDTSSSGTATFLAVLWSSGLTEGGSSGSGLFLNNGHYLVGQLYGGSSSCGSSVGPDYYGRFDVAYNAGLSQWLSPSVRTLNVTKFGAGTGTVSSSPTAINCGSTCSSTFTNGTTVLLSATPAAGSAFGGWSGSCSGSGSCSLTLTSDATVTATFNVNSALTPGAPQNFAAAAGSGQASFTFSPPSNTGGSAIVRYNVSCTGGFSATGLASPIVVTGLQNGVTYSCSATATNATTTGPASNAASVTPVVAPMGLLSAVSPKSHPAVTYELPIDFTQPISGAVTVEPRADNTHRVVFRFNNTVTTSGIVTVTDASGAAVGNATVAIAANQVTVTLTGVDGKRVRVRLNGVNGTLDTSVSIGFLTGDVDSSGAVTASDILRMRGRQGQPVFGTNYPYDDDLDGNISSNDLASAKANSGKALN